MDKQKVLPGEFLCTDEEFVPGANSYSENGAVFSGAAGAVNTDQRLKKIDVFPRKEVRLLQRGAAVFGRVTLVKENSALVSILPEPDAGNKTVINMTNAMLPIRNVSSEYVENLRDEFRIGDIIRAKVTKASSLGIDLATDAPGFGVVKAFCTRCRHPLHLFGNSLRCLNCGAHEKRKISSDYLVK